MRRGNRPRRLGLEDTPSDTGFAVQQKLLGVEKTLSLSPGTATKEIERVCNHFQSSMMGSNLSPGKGCEVPVPL